MKLEEGVLVFKASQRAPEGEIRLSSSRTGRMAEASGCKLEREAVRVTDLGHLCSAQMASLNNGQSDSCQPRSSTHVMKCGEMVWLSAAISQRACQLPW